VVSDSPLPQCERSLLPSANSLNSQGKQNFPLTHTAVRCHSISLFSLLLALPGLL